MVNLFLKRIIFIKENTFISSGNTYCDVILNVDHLGFVIGQFFFSRSRTFKLYSSQIIIAASTSICDAKNYGNIMYPSSLSRYR